ncbi:MAG: hypothetical protein V4547_16905 [Bacteroidota bacterium]
MFYPVEGGSVYEVPDNAFGFVYKCNLPPIGYGVNSITGELQETDVITRSDIPEDCFWDRYVLPLDWKKRRVAEKERQRFDKYYVDPYLENIRATQWKRRLCGIWFANYNPKTKQVEYRYVTGTHYLYATFWKFQGKLMDFRINDMEAWYVVKYCETDPNCLGVNEITKRKLGKTAKLGCWLYERTSRPPVNQHAAFQSKADNDAEEVMKKAIVQPWQKLPDFFRPIYDLMKGDDPNELRFFHTSRRGSTANEEREEEDALESWIEYGASSAGYFDGPELYSYGCDEAGKTKRPVSIKERQNIVRYCSEIDGEFAHRKAYYTTTVEIEPGEEDNYEFQEMTAMSNPLDRDDNGRTMTGLYTYFLPAQKGMYFDRYGYPDEERAITYLLNTRKKLEEEGKTRELSSFKRKNPMTFKEAFSADGAYTLYDPEIISTHLDDIVWRTDLTERGNLEWKDGYEFERPVVQPDGTIEYILNELEWHTKANGKFEKPKGWMPKEPNSVFKKNGKFLPNNNFANRVGCDPFKYDKTKDKRRSNCAAFNYQIADDLNPDDPYNDSFTLRYAFRESSTRLANMDILKMVWWCGSQVLFERNVNHWKRDFQDWNCEGFLMWLPGEDEPGIYTDGKGTVVQMICNFTESYINKFIKKVFFKTLMRKETGWLGFKVEDTQVYDEPMAAGITLIAVKGKKYNRTKDTTRIIEDIMPYRKAI